MNITKKVSTFVMAGSLMICTYPTAVAATNNAAAVSKSIKQQKVIYPVIVDNHIGFMDSNGKIKKTSYNFVYLFDENVQLQDGLFPFLASNGNMGFIDYNGRIVIKPLYPILGELSDGMVMFRTITNGRMLSGYMNEKGEIAAKPQFTYANSFSEGLAKVFVNENDYGYINKLGQWAIKPKLKSVSVTDGVGTFHEGMASFRVSNGTGGYLWGFIDTKGNEAVKPAYSFAWQYKEGLAKVELNGKSGFIDKKGNMVINPSFDFAGDFSEGLASVTVAGKTGYIDNTGKVVIKPQFTNATEFHEGLASGILDNKLCFFNKSGKIIVNTDYTDVSSFNEGMCIVSKNGLYGVIDKTGKVIVKPQYRYINDYENGLALVIDNKNYRLYINKTGKAVWKTQKPVNFSQGQG